MAAPSLGLRHQFLQGVYQLLLRLWPHQACHFLSVLQKNQRGPELDPKTAPQALAGAVFYFDVGYVRTWRKCLFNQRLSALAMAAPRGSKLDDRGTRQAVHIVGGWGLCKVLCGVGHGVIGGL